MEAWSVLLSGFSLSFGLILAIGAQNAFVLRQGLRGEHVLAVCLTCALSDAILILAGVYGFQYLAEGLPGIVPFMQIGGACYLIVFGLRCFYSAWKSDESLVPTGSAAASLGFTVLKCLALTWLNPHVYLDTVLLLGAVSTTYTTFKVYFAAGAVLASLVFFFSLGYLSRFLRPFLASAKSWRILDFMIGLLMMFLAVKLLLDTSF